jgi:hypothetical protein
MIKNNFTKSLFSFFSVSDIVSRRVKSAEITNVNNDERVRGDKQKAADKKERA